MEKFNEDFIKDTAKMFADMQSDDIKLNYKDGVYYGYIEGFKKALELVKNNGVLDDVSKPVICQDWIHQDMLRMNYKFCSICGTKLESK